MLRDLVRTIVGIFLAIMVVLVGGRFIALLAGANPDSELVQRLYSYSDFWVKPFFGVLGLENKVDVTGGVFEPASLIALLVYLVLGAIVMAVISGSFYGYSRHLGRA